jgi:hypothetical protein
MSKTGVDDTTSLIGALRGVAGPPEVLNAGGMKATCSI